MINLFAMIILHIQLLIGLGLYFINARGKVAYVSGWMSETVYRFYGLEHIFGMVLAITLITIGRKKAEKLQNTRDKHRRIMFAYLLGLLIILLTIPWPFREVLGAQWF